jgi:hypothetical protein
MRGRLALACALSVAACGLLPAAGQARTAPYPIQTIPAIKGVEIELQGKTYRTDSKGRATLRPVGLKTDQIKPRVKIADKRIGPTDWARFSRWYGRNTITFDHHYRISFSFRDLEGEPVDPSMVSSITVKSRTGVRTELRENKSVWLQGTRVVPFTGQLVSKDIDYQVERAYVDGANVVNRAQQRFTPRTKRNLSVRLLFYPLKIVTKDAMFGTPVGEAVELRYPSGKTIKRDLKDGEVTLPSLPRGTYDVKVVASGVSFTRPVSVSRKQEVELKVISYLDMLLAAGALVALAVGLLLARRPHLTRAIRRRLRLERRQPVGAGRD